MKVAIVGSRNMVVLLSDYIPEGTTEIISGGARGVDTCARMHAETNDIPFRGFRPDYLKYGKKAPIIRNNSIIEAADLVIAFWDGRSRGTKYVIDRCQELKKPIKIYNLHV